MSRVLLWSGVTVLALPYIDVVAQQPVRRQATTSKRSQITLASIDEVGNNQSTLDDLVINGNSAQ